MREHLQPWYDQWMHQNESTNLLYVNRDSDGKPYLKQVHFIRDILARLVWQGVDYHSLALALPRDDCKETAWVIGEHRSKSVVLPVYSFERPDLGLTITLRYNYHNWTVSVKSETPISRWVKHYGYHGCCFFEGFPSDRQYGPYGHVADDDGRQFSLSIIDDYELYAFVRQLMEEFHDGSC